MAETINEEKLGVGLSLGAQAGEDRLRDVMAEASLSHVRKAAETSMALIREVRP